jgi:hypothetical protein
MIKIDEKAWFFMLSLKLDNRGCIAQSQHN